MNFEDLKSPELQEKLKSIKTLEELLALANAEGYELSAEQIAAISGPKSTWPISSMRPASTLASLAGKRQKSISTLRRS